MGHCTLEWPDGAQFTVLTPIDRSAIRNKAATKDKLFEINLEKSLTNRSHSLVVRIPRCGRGDPGSIPGEITFWTNCAYGTFACIIL